MKCINKFSFLVVFIFTYLVGCSQKNDNKYETSNYKLFARGSDMEYPYVLLYRNRSDSNWSFKEVYFDSAYSRLISRCFFYKNVANGPYFSYSNGKLFVSANFKDGKNNGKQLNYKNGRVKREAYFKNGIKVGTWTEYDSAGKIIRVTKYDNSGNLVSVVKF